jgi:hypothetical protein
MTSVFVVVLFSFFFAIASALQSRSFLSRIVTRSPTTLFELPLELTGQLDPNKKWDVIFRFNGEDKVVSISEDTSVLLRAEKVFGSGALSILSTAVCY